DHKRILWGYDDKGSEFYTLKVRDVASATDIPDVIADTGGGGTWDARGDGFFYARLDPSHRPSRIYYHRLGAEAASDRLVYEEADPGFFMNVGGSRRNDW